MDPQRSVERRKLAVFPCPSNTTPTGIMVRRCSYAKVLGLKVSRRAIHQKRPSYSLRFLLYDSPHKLPNKNIPTSYFGLTWANGFVFGADTQPMLGYNTNATNSSGLAGLKKDNSDLHHHQLCPWSIGTLIAGSSLPT